MFVDSHIHLTHALFAGNVPCIVSAEKEDQIEYIDGKQLVDTFKNNKIAFCVEPGIDLESNYRILELAGKYPDFVYPAVGVHPTRAPHTKWKERKVIEHLAQDKSVIAIGELGLDYHYERKKQHRFRQKMWFIWQLKLACKKKLPLVLHIRLADKDAMRLFRISRSDSGEMSE